MYLLALETSAKAASCAVSRDDQILAEFFTNSGLTHSETVMPMIESMLGVARLGINDIDVFAAAVGPGSFTGLRIGIAAVKGMAAPYDKPCVAVSSLMALAYNISAFDGVAASLMDARRGQVYAAVFKTCGGEVERLTSDAAVSADELAETLGAYKEPVMLVGDGARLHYEAMARKIPKLFMAPPNLLHQRAGSVLLAARKILADGGGADTAETLAPVYLRLPQAERERMLRKSQQ